MLLPSVAIMITHKELELGKDVCAHAQRNLSMGRRNDYYNEQLKGN